MPVVTFKATSKSLKGLAVENKVRDFTVIMDEPPSLGGTDTGMNPVEALLAALGSCQVIVAQAFAKAQGINLEEIWVDLEGDLDPAGFLKGAEGVRPGFQEIRFVTHFKTNDDAEKVAAFQQFIQSRCPVGDTIFNGCKIVPGDFVIEK